jgi:hypothetical protein
VGFFGIAAGRERGIARHVRKQDGDLPALAHILRKCRIRASGMSCRRGLFKRDAASAAEIFFRMVQEAAVATRARKCGAARRTETSAGTVLRTASQTAYLQMSRRMIYALFPRCSMTCPNPMS